MGLQTGSEFRHHAISARLPAAFSSVGKTLVVQVCAGRACVRVCGGGEIERLRAGAGHSRARVRVQFTVKHEKREYSFCGGGYIKLLSASSDQEKFGGDTPYHIMFGPDFCGYDVSRIHVIFNQDGENLLKKDEVKVEYADKNEFTHLYTLVVKPDGTYKVLFDESEKASGKLLDGWAFQQPEFDDPKDHKPSDWVDEAKVADPEDTKPEGWDEIPKQIADPEASKPDDWDEDSDGEWEAPMIDNPKYKGEWKARMIDNPQYKGEWKAKQITNPKYKADVGQYADIGAVGFELWTVNHGSIFDNILVTDDEEAAKKHAKKYFDGLKEKEKTAKEVCARACVCLDY